LSYLVLSCFVFICLVVFCLAWPPTPPHTTHPTPSTLKKN
jgi:hypothetical protein